MQGRAARWNAKRGLFSSLNEFLTSDTSRTHLVSFCSPLGSGGWRGVFRDGPVFPCTHMHPLPQDAERQPITQRHSCLLNLTPAASDLSRRSASWAFITVHHPSAWLWFSGVIVKYLWLTNRLWLNCALNRLLCLMLDHYRTALWSVNLKTRHWNRTHQTLFDFLPHWVSILVPL